MLNRSLESSNTGSHAEHLNNPSRVRNSLFTDSDAVLILALILLLYSDNCDRALIFALVYILL